MSQRSTGRRHQRTFVTQATAQFQPKDLKLVVAIAHQASMFIEINILSEQVKHETIARERSSQLLSPNIAERVMSGQLEVRLGEQRVDDCTVFNSNIRSFTARSENSRPEELVEMLNDFNVIRVKPAVQVGAHIVSEATVVE